MVNQLWLWKIDSGQSSLICFGVCSANIYGPETLVTAFPDRSSQDENSDLLTHISQTLVNDSPINLDDMIKKILDQTMQFLDAPVNAGLNENLLDIFEQSIAFRVRAVFVRQHDGTNSKFKTETPRSRML